jgi:hypothetical protein
MVSLVKDPYIPERAPLWWDDASYIRYQADDGPQGEYLYELNLWSSGPPIIRRWVAFEWNPTPPLPSRAIRRLFARFDAIIGDLRTSPQVLADLRVIDATIPF